MVHEKKKSGDPDYDDKVPADQHVGRIVTAGDGREVLITESNGPVDRVTGQHVNLDDPKGEAGDNRPAPGEVATDVSEVQTYDTEAMPAKNLGTVNSQQELNDKLAEDKPADSGLSEAAKNEAEAPKPVVTRKAK